MLVSLQATWPDVPERMFVGTDTIVDHGLALIAEQPAASVTLRKLDQHNSVSRVHGSADVRARDLRVVSVPHCDFGVVAAMREQFAWLVGDPATSRPLSRLRPVGYESACTVPSSGRGPGSHGAGMRRRRSVHWPERRRPPTSSTASVVVWLASRPV